MQIAGSTVPTDAACTSGPIGRRRDRRHGVISLLAVLLTLTACGASGGRPTSLSLPSPTPTTVNANLTVYVNSDALYALRASDGTLRWTAQGISSPVLVGGVLYGQASGAVVALDAGTRAVLWRHLIDAWLGLWPAVADGVVYVSSSQAQKNGPPIGGSVYALRASDGTLLWRYQTGSNIFVPPTISGGAVYVQSTDSFLYALRASDGALLWRYQVNNFTGAFVAATPAVAEGVVYIGSEDVLPTPGPTVSADRFLLALRTSDGQLLWRSQVGFPGNTAPAVADGVIYVGADHEVDALRASDGTLLWRQPIDSRGSTPAVADGVVYVGADEGAVYAFAAQGGVPRWVWRYQAGPRGETAHPGSPVLVAGMVYVGATIQWGEPPLIQQDPTGAVYALNARDGALRWHYQTPAPAGGSVVVAP